MRIVATLEGRSPVLGSQGSDGSQGRIGRLARSSDVTGVLRRGRSRSGELLVLHVLRRAAAGADAAGPDTDRQPRTTARLTVVASRRVGGAVRRNRAKRLLRAAARPLRWRDDLDVVLVARAGCADSDVHRVGEELVRLAVRLDAVDA